MNEDARILIVDDDPLMLRAQAILFERAGYHVTTAPTGRDGLRLAREIEPDLLLLDVVLPDLDGVELCRRIKAQPALQRTLVVLITALKTAPDEQAEALEAGADTVIRRPIANRELLARVKSLLRIHRAEEQVRASEARYRHIVENAPVGIYRTTPEGEILMANPALIDMLGYDSFEDVAQIDLETEGYHPNYSRRDFERRIQEQGEVRGLESAWQRSDGSTLFVRENARPVYDEDGRLLRYEGIVEDVTERVRRTKRLERLNTVLDAIRDVNHLIVHQRHPRRLIEGACRHLVDTRGYRTAWIALLGRDGEPIEIAQRGLHNCLPATVDEFAEAGLDLCGLEALSAPGVWVADAPCDCPLADAYGGDQLMAVRLEHGGSVRGLMTVSLPKAIQVDEREKALFSEVATDIAFALQSIEMEQERRRADQALQESEERYRTLFESAPEAITLIDLQGIVTDCNPAAEQIAGREREEMIGKPFTELDMLPPEDLSRYTELFSRLLQGDEVEPIAIRTQRHDGTVRYLEAFAAPLIKQGEVAAVQVITRDVTQQKKAEKELRERETLLRKSQEMAHVGSWRHDLREGTSTWSHEAYRILGLEPREVAPSLDVLMDALHPEDRARVQEAYRRAVEEGVPYDLTHRVVRPDGTVRTVRVRTERVTDDAGQPILGFGMVHDITERKRAEEALRENERFLRQVIDTSPNCIFVKDWDGRYVLVNEAIAELYGTSRERMVGSTDRELAGLDKVSPEAAARFLDDDREVMRSGEPKLISEERFTREDGTVRWFQTVKVPLTAPGAQLRLLGVAADITQRKRAQEEIEWLARFPSENPNPVIRVGEDGREILYANKPGQAILEIWYQHADQSTRETWRQVTLDVLASGETRAAEIELNDRVLSLTFAPVPEPGYINVYALDITERKQVTKRLRRLSSAVEQSIEGFVISDTEGRVLYVNQTIEELYGYTREELTGESVFLLNAPSADTQAIQQRFIQEGRWSGELQQRRKDGSTFPALLSLFRVESKTQGVDAVVALVRDISDRRRMQRKLQQQERLAAVGQLAGGIAHDFNNILASIILYAQMPLDIDELHPRVEHACQIILEESHRAADLIQQILDFSRSAMVDTEPLDLASVIQDSLTLLRRTIPEDIRLVSDMTSRPCVVQADATRIHQILMNLALNARDAMPDGGELSIGLNRIHLESDDETPVPDMAPGAWARLAVTDTGVGISDQARAHLFEPFFTTKEEGQGTGLGLAQVYGIVKQHHGLIDVDTAPGEGTTFAVYLPLVQSVDATPPAEDDAAPLEGRGETVLVVEDAEPLRHAVRAGLEAFGYHVVTATDGRAALAALDRHDVDLVLTDVVMPGVGGEDLLHELQKQGRGMKAIAMTGHVVDIDIQGLRQEGFAEALSKPFSIEQLARAVRRVLRDQ